MSYRPLTITAPMYRCWGTMRLECMSPWLREWALPEMHAGIPEMGAVDAWCEVLTTLEDHTLNGNHFVGGVADIAKFFDQIRRGLVFRTCRVAGMPTGVLTAYGNYLENLKVYNCVAGGMGTPYVRVCGIPQRMPFLDDQRCTHHETMDPHYEKVCRH